MFKRAKKQDKNVVEQAISQGGAPTILPPSFPKHRSWRQRLLRGLILLGVLVVVAGAVAWLAYQSNPSQLRKKVVIGSSTITQQDVDKRVEELENYYKLGNQQVAGVLDLEKIAQDDLVMLAALEKEASDRGLTATEDDLANFDKQRFNTEQLQKEREIMLADSKIADSLKAKTRITYYLEKLHEPLVDSRDFLMVQVPFDTPLHHSKSPQEQKQLHADAVELLQQRFLPAVEQGQSPADVGKLADVNFDDPNQKPSDPEFYKNRLFTYSQLVKDFPNKQFKEFNDIENNDEVFGWHIENLVDTDDMLYSLQNSGDHTPVFASKAGAHMILRLQAKHDGAYRSYKQMLTTYKETYTLTSLQKARISLNKKLNDFQRWLNRLVSTIPPLTSPVQAGADNCNHSSHEVVFRFFALDQWNNFTPGVRIDHYGRGICYPETYSQNTSANFPENCNDNAPIWDRAANPGYTITQDWVYPGWSVGINSWGVIDTWFRVYYPYTNFVNTASVSNSPGPVTVAPGGTATLTASITSYTPWGWYPMNSTNPTYLLVRNENQGVYISGSTAQMTGTGSPYEVQRYYSPGPTFWDWVWQFSTVLVNSTLSATFTVTVSPSTPPGVYCFQSYAYPSSYGSGAWQTGSRACITVAAGGRTPFATSEFGDIHAGTTWGEAACLVNPTTADSTPGNIAGQVSGANGSKADYIVSSGGTINSFGSASDPGGANSNLLKFGGASGGYGQICRPDIAKRFINDPSSYTKLGTDNTTYTIADVGSLASGVYYHKGDVDITGTSTIPVGKSITFVVEGTVLVRNSINQGAGNVSLNTIPSFGLVATGNINLHENVTHLYGLYAAGSALPGSIGVINTCQNDTSTTTFNPQIKLVNACNNTLVVEGALIGNNIYFRRKPATSDVTTNNNPAERISLIPQLLLKPPVGFSTVSLQIRSEGERPPVY